MHHVDNDGWEGNYILSRNAGYFYTNERILPTQFFSNTPNILPPILQQAGRPAFKFRFFLAAALSTSYGIYNSYELYENRAIPGTEEYLDSEKYEIKHWDWSDNIRDNITRIN